MTQITPKNIPPAVDPDDSVSGGAVRLPGANPLGGDDLNVPFVPDQEPEDREPSPETEGPLDPQHDHEKRPGA